MTLSEQLSVRLTEPQREYVKKETARLRGDTSALFIRWTEADVIRCIIHDAMSRGFEVAVQGMPPTGGDA